MRRAAPLSARDEDLKLLHVVDVRDALDERASDIVRFASGRVMTVRSYSFYDAHLDGAVVFAVPQLLGSEIFLTDVAVRAIREAGLTGFEAELVWES